ncbi:hypothetical protein KC19_VG219400 [Ceratodon purpureus]|uniref:Uncharacterized protein n=1 Tax=Ceratodon purpureus TaxID=3225 RepID=A0A8T0HSW8_CERPU|nr:hypothetical protein KC19_VG219400 [Ceratodon purpureus]KAG0573896.1 hypothetical protein KC19_VG219400 [Ceratodon purpureus]KAG0573897.1 hypothetical protein KC19_VG219400 [Ceratodon purpureus]
MCQFLSEVSHKMCYSTPFTLTFHRRKQSTDLKMMRECSKQWYRDRLCLSRDGFLPSKASRHLYPKSECPERLGTPNCVGACAWHHRGGVHYVQYVKELYERVHQKKLHPSDMLPWHFARGLLAEEDGLLVDWAKYTDGNRRGGKRNAKKKILKKYGNLRRHVPFHTRR